MAKNNETVSSNQLAVGRLQSAVCSRLPTVYCPLPTVICLLITAYCLLLAACFQPESGCLDIEATNFNISADESCGEDDTDTGCPCTYPVFSFNPTQITFDSTTYRQNNIYFIDEQFVKINSINFFLSGFEFRRVDGGWETVKDTIGLTVLKDNLLKDTILTDDFIFIERQNNISIGSILKSGSFDSLRFVVGIKGLANTANPDSISNTSHPLAEMDMHTGSQEDGYIFNRINFQVLSREPVVVPDTMSTTTDTMGTTIDTMSTIPDTMTTITETMSTTRTVSLRISKNTGNGQLVTVQKLISAKSPIGADFSLGTLTINHAKWFDGIKFVTDTDAVMIEKIVANTPNVFSISN